MDAKRSKKRRLTDRFRDWRHRRSRGQTPAPQGRSTELPPAGDEASHGTSKQPAPAKSPEGQSAAPPSANNEALHGASSKQPAKLVDECSALWEEAYAELKKKRRRCGELREGPQAPNEHLPKGKPAGCTCTGHQDAAGEGPEQAVEVPVVRSRAECPGYRRAHPQPSLTIRWIGVVGHAVRPFLHFGALVRRHSATPHDE
ncbi:hypothetical protein B0T14DRAFT_85524 [Immersiella caudata]|uniref:Uncharacterized protein n=1 Tax=Immersiella caudata TaxID=314043 RepID=A0AA39XHE8_9PEZI|nr:hypothetical protein B0T14DRAFT_85524 [Immersiella caudata]